MSAVILLGLVLGSWASGVWGWFFWFTRPYRKARSLFAFAATYFVIAVSSLGSLWLLLGTLERIGVGRAPQGYAALYAWTIGFIGVAILAMRAEMKWRKSIRTDDKRVGPPRE
jgi:hypothetical protein